MLLKTRYGLEFTTPSESQIASALNSLSPGDQLVLVDQDLNELRVFGPQNGTYHVFCSLSREGGPFQAERDLSPRDTLAILVRFTRQDLEWARDFHQVPPPPPRPLVKRTLTFIAILTLAGMLVTLWLNSRR